MYSSATSHYHIFKICHGLLDYPVPHMNLSYIAFCLIFSHSSLSFVDYYPLTKFDPFSSLVTSFLPWFILLHLLAMPVPLLSNIVHFQLIGYNDLFFNSA